MKTWRAIEELEGLLEMGCESVTFKADFVRRLLEERDAELLEMTNVARQCFLDKDIIRLLHETNEDCVAEFKRRRQRDQ